MADTTDLDLEEIHAFAVDLAKKAGQILLDAAEKRTGGLGYEQKMNAVDLVTETDEDVEAFIKSSISAKYPTHKFIGEESYSKLPTKDYLLTAAPSWCVDPLDGTVNYIHLFPLVCVSISFLHNGVPVIGVINAPFTSSLFHARRGAGAFLNDRRLPLQPGVPLPEDAPRGCIFSCEWGKDRRDVEGGNMYRKAESFLNIAAERGGRGGKGGMAHGIRSLGSAALDLAYTATGAFDIWWEGGCWEWDVAAGICILLESGGLVTTGAPPPNPETDPILPVHLGSRKYLGIRAAPDTEKETGREAQERVVREVWKRVVGLDYSRPGV
ncbi:hypothetical protein RUND412_011262 [Rhizina undulata]